MIMSVGLAYLRYPPLLYFHSKSIALHNVPSFPMLDINLENDVCAAAVKQQQRHQSFGFFPAKRCQKDTSLDCLQCQPLMSEPVLEQRKPFSLIL